MTGILVFGILWRVPSDAMIRDPLALRCRSATIAWTQDHRRAFVNQRERPWEPGRASSDRAGASSFLGLFIDESLTFARPLSDRLKSVGGCGCGGGGAEVFKPAPRGDTARLNAAGGFLGEIGRGVVGRGGRMPYVFFGDGGTAFAEPSCHARESSS